MGSEFSYEDISSDEIGKYNYEYLGKEPCLMDQKKTKCLKIKRYPNYKYSGYSKQIIYYDIEQLRVVEIKYYYRKTKP